MPDSATVTGLVARARDGDKHAWDEIVERFAPMVWSICRRFRLSESDVEDVGQNVWLQLVEHLPSVREPAALPGWLRTTAQRECLRAVRTSQQRTQREHRSGVDMITTAEEQRALDADLLAAERDAVLRDAFAQLPSHCQELLGLLTGDPPLSYAEIARRLNMALGGVGPNRSRCLDKLRRCPALAMWLRDRSDNEQGGVR